METNDLGVRVEIGKQYGGVGDLYRVTNPDGSIYMGILKKPVEAGTYGFTFFAAFSDFPEHHLVEDSFFPVNPVHSRVREVTEVERFAFYDRMADFGKSWDEKTMSFTDYFREGSIITSKWSKDLRRVYTTMLLAEDFDRRKGDVCETVVTYHHASKKHSFFRKVRIGEEEYLSFANQAVRDAFIRDLEEEGMVWNSEWERFEFLPLDSSTGLYLRETDK